MSELGGASLADLVAAIAQAHAMALSAAREAAEQPDEIARELLWDEVEAFEAAFAAGYEEVRKRLTSAGVDCHALKLADDRRRRAEARLRHDGK